MFKNAILTLVLVKISENKSVKNMLLLFMSSVIMVANLIMVILVVNITHQELSLSLGSDICICAICICNICLESIMLVGYSKIIVYSVKKKPIYWWAIFNVIRQNIRCNFNIKMKDFIISDNPLKLSLACFLNDSSIYQT